jgi:LAS superfamily LD-carboxypeptidase LdcB
MRPDVAAAFDRMAAAARSEAGPYLSITSAFRSDAEQARLFASKPMRHLFSAL